MKRLLLVVNHAGFFLSHRLPIALAAQQAGYDVHVATPLSRHVPLIESQGLPWHAITMTRSGRNPRAEWSAMRDIERLYRRERPDIVHQVTAKPVIYGTIAARRAGVPAVVNAIAGLGHLFTDGSSRFLLRAAAGAGFRFALKHPNMRVIFQNDENRDLFVSNSWLRPEQAVLIPGSGVDMELFRPSAEGVAGPPVVILPARLIYSKGVLEFVQAARATRSGGATARFALVGEPDPDNPGSVDRATIDEWVREGVIEYWGRQDDMPAVYARASIVCLPSTYAEGVPKSLIEAAAAGLPSITTDTPGCRDIVRHERTGLLFPAGDVSALIDALRVLLSSAEIRGTYGAAARRHAEGRFSLDSVIAATLRTYAELSP